MGRERSRVSLVVKKGGASPLFGHQTLSVYMGKCCYSVKAPPARGLAVADGASSSGLPPDVTADLLAACQAEHLMKLKGGPRLVPTHLIQLTMPADAGELVADRGVLLHEMAHQHLVERGESPKHEHEPWCREIMRLHKAISGKRIWAAPESIAKAAAGEDGKRRSIRVQKPCPEAGMELIARKDLARWPHSCGLKLGGGRQAGPRRGVSRRPRHSRHGWSRPVSRYRGHRFWRGDPVTRTALSCVGTGNGASRASVPPQPGHCTVTSPRCPHLLHRVRCLSMSLEACPTE